MCEQMQICIVSGLLVHVCTCNQSESESKNSDLRAPFRPLRRAAGDTAAPIVCLGLICGDAFLTAAGSSDCALRASRSALRAAARSAAVVCGRSPRLSLRATDTRDDVDVVDLTEFSEDTRLAPALDPPGVLASAGWSWIAGLYGSGGGPPPVVFGFLTGLHSDNTCNLSEIARKASDASR